MALMFPVIRVPSHAVLLSIQERSTSSYSDVAYSILKKS
jgi:hypothetical protein